MPAVLAFIPDEHREDLVALLDGMSKARMICKAEIFSQPKNTFFHRLIIARAGCGFVCWLDCRFLFWLWLWLRLRQRVFPAVELVVWT